MARKRPNETTDDGEKIDRAAGDIAEGLAAELTACRQAVAYCVKIACDETLDDYDADRTNMFESTSKLMLASSALASALARLKGEFHQRITIAHQTPENSSGASGKRTVYPRLAEGASAVAQRAKGEGGGEN